MNLGRGLAKNSDNNFAIPQNGLDRQNNMRDTLQ